MRRVAIVVEGKGDVEAASSLLCKSAAVFGLRVIVDDPPIRAGEVRKLQRPGELERFLELASLRQDANGVLLLLDLDDGCAAALSVEFRARAKPISEAFGKPIGICFCVREFEAWFLSNIGHLRQVLPDYGISAEAIFPNASEIRGAKEALHGACSTRKYKPMRDQTIFAKKIDVPSLASQNRSFRKFLKEVTGLT
jgi:Domain of unknown function (DUF4276)